MNYTLKIKLISMLLIFASINSICFGCCGCCPGGIGGLATKGNSGPKPSNPIFSNPIGDNMLKSGKIEEGAKDLKCKSEEKEKSEGLVEESKLVEKDGVEQEEGEEKNGKEDMIENALAEYMNKRDSDNRKDIEEKWSCKKNEKGKYYIKYRKFSGILNESDESLITRIDNDDSISKLKINIKLEFSKDIYFTFYNSECTLGDLVKSLSLLNKKYRINKDEHLGIIDSNGLFKPNRYINLSSAIMYRVKNGRIFRPYILNGNYDTCTVPCFNGNIFYNKNRKEENIDQDPNKNGFNDQPFSPTDIDKFKLILKTS